MPYGRASSPVWNCIMLLNKNTIWNWNWLFLEFQFHIFFPNYVWFHEMETVEDSQSSLKISLPQLCLRWVRLFLLNSQPPEFQWSIWFSLEQWPTEQVGRLCWGGAPVALGRVLPVHLAVTCRRKQVQPISLLSRLLTPERSYIDFPLTHGH